MQDSGQQVQHINSMLLTQQLRKYNSHNDQQTTSYSHKATSLEASVYAVTARLHVQ